ncbi:MAG: Gfo/Idh/MocA family oxidoreductase [Clostridia bacterium]|nr:Gfo/Idh/MocA family oxidoreductase [Clostridia bacterium]
MKQISVVLVGAGNRANVYAELALRKPEMLRVVGIVDPDPVRTKIIRERYSVPTENCFSSVDEFVKRDKFADAVINGTMDHLHVPTSIPILKKGYDMLLEKPFAVNKEEMWELVKVANEENRKVIIGHVLRYTPFYSAIKKHIVNGDIGEIMNIYLCEHVSYHHLGTAYVRGKWASEKKCHATMLLAKCCHDMDIMMWMLSETKPVNISSFGSQFQFVEGKKPEGAGTRCMEDCPYVDTCLFSAYSHYIDHPDRWAQYVWKCIEGEGEVDIERKKESLRTDNPYGKCAWDYNRDTNVESQTVIVNFESGALGTLNMVGGAASPERNIHIIGTKGEIKGSFETSKYSLKKIAPSTEKGYVEELYDLEVGGDMTGAQGAHGGGDGLLTEDFVKYLNGEEPSISCTDINDSTLSHLAVFKADESRMNKRIEEVDIHQ